MVVISLVNPIGKIVKINDAYYRIPGKVLVKEKEVEKVIKYLRIINVEYIVEEGIKSSSITTQAITINDQVEIKEKEKVQIKENKESDVKQKQKKKSRRSAKKKNDSKNK